MSEKLNRVLHLRECIDTGLSESALDILEAVLAGAGVNDGWWYGTDCWSVIKPADKPCSTCGGSGEKRVYDGGISGEWIEVPCDDLCHGSGVAP